MGEQIFKERTMHDKQKLYKYKTLRIPKFTQEILIAIFSSETCHRMLENWYVLALIMIGVTDNFLDILSRNVSLSKYRCQAIFPDWH